MRQNITRTLSTGLTSIALALTMVGPFAVMPAATLAAETGDPLDQSSTDLSTIGTNGFGQTITDPKAALAIRVASIIRIALGLLGIILVVLVIYAGFLWMTARGNDDQITTARSTLQAAIIGLVIIIMAYAISAYVISRLSDVVQG